MAGNGFGGGVHAQGNAVLDNVTVFANHTAGNTVYGCALNVSTGAMTVSNSIVEANTCPSGSTLYGGANPPVVAYTSVYGNDGLPGVSGVMTDPADFVDVTGAWAAWDLHLSAASALVDAGDPGVLDPDGSVSDLGAYGGPGADW